MINHAAAFLLLAATLVMSAAAQDHSHKAPLYWSVYENQIVKEQSKDPDVHISEEEWRANIDWVDQNLKDFGYRMVCIDGWGDVSQVNSNGYRLSHSRHWKHDYAWWSAYLQKRGLQLGMYGNPLWVHAEPGDTNLLIRGTRIPVSSLRTPGEESRFPWVPVDRPGAEEYVKGYVRFYADMGVRFLRVDFLSWFEDGQDRNYGRVGPSRPRAHYETALRWMREAADESGLFLSLVMPHLNDDAAAERRYGHMFRVNEDTDIGTWWRWSGNERGVKRDGWSVYANAVDGLTYWSRLSGRGKVILDPDFIRIHTFANDDEKKSVISLCLLAGAPVSVADQVTTIGDNLWAYTNRELLALNEDGFAGQPLSHEPAEDRSQIWYGQLSGGEWVVGLFNREDVPRMRGIEFKRLGVAGPARVRDLWSHEDLGEMASFNADVPPHGCRVIRIAPSPASP